MGAHAYTVVSDLPPFDPHDVIFEAGSERGEGSTTYLAGNATLRGCHFITVDPDPERAADLNADLDPAVAVITALAQDVLTRARPSELPGRVRCAYLDAADWPYSWHLADAELVRSFAERYARWGGELSRTYSAQQHLEIAYALVPHAAPVCDVIVDDTWLRDGEVWQGKGMRAAPYLLTQGFTVVHVSHGDEPTDGYCWLRRSTDEPS